MKTIQGLNEAKIVHRDIKAENILVNEVTNELKLIDFGFSKLHESGNTMKTASGSPLYSAPEILAGERYDPIKSDIWSSGVLLYYMLCGMDDVLMMPGYLPFYDENIGDLYSKIIFGELEIPSSLNSEAVDLVKKVLNTNSNERISIEEILYSYPC